MRVHPIVFSLTGYKCYHGDMAVADPLMRRGPGQTTPRVSGSVVTNVG